MASGMVSFIIAEFGGKRRPHLGKSANDYKSNH